MRLGKYQICISKVVRFHPKLHVLRNSDNKDYAIYHWLWFTFSQTKGYRIIIHFRSLEYIFLKNWYRIREGEKWVYPPERYAKIYDIGFISVGYAY